MEKPILNWKELQGLVGSIQDEIKGLFLERVIIPERKEFPQGYLKNEWALRLTGKTGQKALSFSVRQGAPFLIYYPDRGPQNLPQATHSAFDLSLSKYLKGTRLTQVFTPPKERIVVLCFSASENENFGLVLVLIPAAPEALLVQLPVGFADRGESWKVLAHTRAKEQSAFSLPSGAGAPESPPVRKEWVEKPAQYTKAVEEFLKSEAFGLRHGRVQQYVRQLLKQKKSRLKQTLTAVSNAEKEPDWQKFGDLLKYSLYSHPPIQDRSIQVLDFETNQTVLLPHDPKLSLVAQVEKFYQNAKRKERRIEEAKNRCSSLQRQIDKIEKYCTMQAGELDFEALESIENELGLRQLLKGLANGPTGSVFQSEVGKTFRSAEGLIIHVGRDKGENQEITFRIARGNDLWLHVKGRPGAHVIVSLPPGKSASLETLLDAATLAVYYSNGENWGKTEVDYTYRKYVKRIKKSTEVSYTHNKTIVLEFDPERKKRLLDQQGSDSI